MDKPKITWHTRFADTSAFSTANELFAGTYTSNNDVTAEIQLWNNRWGTKAVENLLDFGLRISFEKYEDSSLLKFCSVTFKNKALDIQNFGTYAIVKFPHAFRLVGWANNGIASENPENVATIIFKFHVTDNTIQFKENDLKSLYFEIIHY